MKNLNYVAFSSAEEMLDCAQNHDLYNPETGAYVFGYNEAGALCEYILDEEEVKDIIVKRQNGDDCYWGGYLGPGGDIYDDPEDENLDEDELEDLYSNLNYCEDHYTENWVYCSDYERGLLEGATRYATNIKWDVDYEDNGELPKEIEIPKGMTDMDEIADYLSSVTGYCHDGYAISVVFEKEHEDIER